MNSKKKKQKQEITAALLLCRRSTWLSRGGQARCWWTCRRIFSSSWRCQTSSSRWQSTATSPASPRSRCPSRSTPSFRRFVRYGSPRVWRQAASCVRINCNPYTMSFASADGQCQHAAQQAHVAAEILLCLLPQLVAFLSSAVLNTRHNVCVAGGAAGAVRGRRLPGCGSRAARLCGAFRRARRIDAHGAGRLPPVARAVAGHAGYARHRRRQLRRQRRRPNAGSGRALR